jgi:hypothetical protein
LSGGKYNGIIHENFKLKKFFANAGFAEFKIEVIMSVQSL